jgi:hypothetical protein
MKRLLTSNSLATFFGVLSGVAQLAAVTGWNPTAMQSVAAVATIALGLTSNQSR